MRGRVLSQIYMPKLHFPDKKGKFPHSRTFTERVSVRFVLFQAQPGDILCGAPKKDVARHKARRLIANNIDILPGETVSECVQSLKLRCSCHFNCSRIIVVASLGEPIVTPAAVAADK